MSVLLPNAELRVRTRTRPAQRDSHGLPVRGPVEWLEKGPYPGAAVESPEGDVQPEMQRWRLRLDAELWPVRPGDEVTDGERFWVVQASSLAQVPEYPDVDHVSVTAHLRLAPDPTNLGP